MPSPMIHLLAAHIYAPDASGLFYAGSIMPDYTNDRDKKDTIHFRDVPDKWGALSGMAAGCDPADDFLEGWLFHLFTDRRWDEGILPNYIAKSVPDAWFLPYREQTKLASFWLFHNSHWAGQVWDKILEAPLKSAAFTNAPSRKEMDWYSKRVFERHRDNTSGSSSDFPPDMVESFAKDTAVLYKSWRFNK
ncbi:MAG: hypothetical protein AB9835_07825 [Eubacteriales bacterium]